MLEIFVDKKENQEKVALVENGNLIEYYEEDWMKRIFFVDYENVWERGLESIENIESTDRIVMFHGHQRTRKITENVYQKLKQCAGCVEYVDLEMRTKNSMDFEICTYIGYLVGKYGTNTEYIIVSGDKGYDAAIEFIRKKEPDAKIKRIGSTKEAVDINELRAKVSDLLHDEPRKVKSFTTEAMYKEETLKDYHDHLNSVLPQTGSMIYKKTRELFAEYRGIELDD